MTEKGTIKQTLLGGLTVGLLLLLFSLSGCGNTKSQQEDKNQQSQSAEAEKKKINFSEKKYQERIVDNRIAIAEYPNHYEQEIQEIQNLSYPNIHFTEDCTVDPFPEELSRLSVFHTTEHGMSVQEGVETLENWLVSIGKRDDIKYRKKSGVECLCRYDFGDGISNLGILSVSGRKLCGIDDWMHVCSEEISGGKVITNNKGKGQCYET